MTGSVQRPFRYAPLLGLVAVLIVPAEVRSEISFLHEVRPILEAKCFVCHQGESPQAGLHLETRDAILRGGKSGPAVIAGAPESSLLLQKIASGAMPPVGDKVSDSELESIRSWIQAGARGEGSAQLVTEQDVLPIFQMRCVVCHGKSRREGGLDLRTLESRLRGGDAGPAMVPGDPQASLLYRRITSREMPPQEMIGKVNVRSPTDTEVEVLRQWIAAGAQPAPREVVTATERESPIEESALDFWAFQPPIRPAVPAIGRSETVRGPIDAFLLRRLKEKDLGFSPEAKKLELMRRACIDLTGMPPTPQEIAAYLEDESPDAYEQLIDRLLASPHYGERWAQYWLDLAGYADSEGVIDADKIRPHAWRYRDAVIRAFNADQPYDRFLLEQIAGDELIDRTHLGEVTQRTVDTLAATGFLRMTPDGTYSPANGSLAERMDVIADEIHVLSTAVMGITVGCARCHDHKYDPLPQRDYYRLSAILQSAFDPYDWTPPTERLLDVALETERSEAEKWNAPLEAEIKRLEEGLAKKSKPLRKQLLDEQMAKLPEAVQRDLRMLASTAPEKRNEIQKYLAKKFADILEVSSARLEARFADFKMNAENARKAIGEVRERLKTVPKIRALFDMGGDPSPVYLLGRGDAQTLVERVSPGVPSAFRAGLEPFSAERPWPNQSTSGNRLALARWLTQPNHPLTARVMVNRIWLHHFGRGIVATPSNFGRTGDLPSHPELLDWLATEFMSDNWSVKGIHRLIMTSAAYRQSSRISEEAARRDPDNLLLSRMPLRRLDAEALYDSILRATGRLDPTPFGEPDPVEVLASGEIVVKSAKKGRRRAIYILRRRKTPVTLLDVFDLPQLNPNCTLRGHSTVATQALQIRNGETVRGHARFLAGRLMDQHPQNVGEQIDQLYLRILTRLPTAQERDQAFEALKKLIKHWRNHLEDEDQDAPRGAAAEWSALGSLAHALLSSAEFLYVD